MPREYRHIKEYEVEILKMKYEGKTKREIGKQFGFSFKQVHNFISRYNENQRRIDAGLALNKRGRPAKNTYVTEEDKITELRYKMNRKDSQIKQLEMENELLRDFLSETGRK